MRIKADLAGQAIQFALAFLCGAAVYYSAQERLAAISLFWPPVGVLIGVLLRSERGRWPFWLSLTMILIVGYGMLAGHSLIESLGVFVADLCTALLAVFLLGRVRSGFFELKGLYNLFAFVGLAGIVAPLAGAATGSVFLAAAGEIDLVETFASYWTGLAVSVVIVTPCILLWRWQTLVELFSQSRAGELVLALLLAAAGPSVGSELLGQQDSIFAMPILLWIAIRFGSLLAALASLLHAVCALSYYVLITQAVAPLSLTDFLYFEFFLAVTTVAAALTVSLAVEEREETNAALASGEARWRALMQHAPVAIGIRELDGGTRFLNEEARLNLERFSETGRMDTLPTPFQSVIQREFERLAQGGPSATTEHELTAEDGSIHHLRITRFAIPDEQGKIFAVGSISQDITEVRRAYEQLNQAQKMEAVGQLTGGVAHDFNNLLAVIIGNLEFVLEALPPETQSAGQVQSAFHAAERGAALVQRLLAFSRRQALRPEILDLNASMNNAEALLRRALGKHVAIEFSRDSGLWKALADPAQVESALINLAINARDSMPSGGKLTIETSNVTLDEHYTKQQADELEPGDYAMIAVSDTGSGMAEYVRRHAFDPFFTTKPIGRGSGLGLSMVQGFAKQSGGHVAIYSEEGHGTTVKLYLPRALTDEDSTGDGDPSADQLGNSVKLTVLVVEDDADVLELAARNLKSLGHSVLAAPDGESALEIAAQAPKIDMLLTDVVLSSQISGPDLAREIRKRIPGLATLFMSGYTANGVVHHGRLDPGVILLQKPFRKADLARAIEAALEKRCSEDALAPH